MPPVRRRPKIFNVRRYLPQNRVQQERIRIPQPEYRPLRMDRRDSVQRGLLKQTPDWFVTHRRGAPGRTLVGGDPNESRAISELSVPGSLPERIVFLELIKRGYVEGVDFTFQSSQAGGRIELGGIVVDFLFELKRIALQVDGPTHDDHLRQRKDQEQEGILASMGFTTIRVRTDIIENPLRLEAWFRQHLDPGSTAIVEDSDFYIDEAGGG